MHTDRRDWTAAGVLGVGAALAVLIYGGPSSGDDTFIYMRYAGHAVAGHGYVYNSGEPSHGVTSPAWLVLMTPLTGVCGNTIGVWKLAGSALFGAAAGSLALALRRTGLRLELALLFAAFGLLEPNNLRWTSSGMENGLVLLVVVALVQTFRGASETRRAPVETRLGALLGCLPFVRPELAILAGATALAYMVPARDDPRVRIRPLVVAGIVALALAFLTGTMFGRVVPQSVWAKAFLQEQAGTWYGLSTAARIVLGGAGGGLILMMASSPSPVWFKRWRFALLASVLVWVAAFAESEQLVSTRYGSYLAAPLVISGAWALAATQSVAPAGRRGFRRMWVGACVQVILAVSLLTYVFPVTRVAEGEEIRQLASAVRAGTTDQARIALTEIGAFGFYSGRYIVDLVGLTDRDILAWRLDGHRSLSGMAALEEILLRRGATHYVDTNAGPNHLQGRRLRFEALAEQVVRRNYFSTGQVTKTVWRAYRIEQLY